MRKDAGRQFEAQEKKLAPILDKIPAFKDFPVEDFWRLGIDHKYQKENATSSIDTMNRRDTMSSSDVMEDEPYFLVGTMRGLYFTLTTLGKKLTPELYQLLHYECMKDTVIVKNGMKLFSEPGFRHLKIYKGNDGLFFKRRGYSLSRFTPARLNEVGEMYDSIRTKNDPSYKEDPRYKEKGHPVGRMLYCHPLDKLDEHEVLPSTEEECEACFQCIVDKYYEERDQIRSKIMLAHNQNEWSWDFVESLSEQEIQEVLTPIGHCCRELELSHLYDDCNGRVNGFCVLNKLLLENCLSPTIMMPNPYAIDFNGIKEIIAAIRDGQVIFESYKQPDGEKTAIVGSGNV